MCCIDISACDGQRLLFIAHSCRIIQQTRQRLIPVTQVTSITGLTSDWAAARADEADIRATALTSRTACAAPALTSITPGRGSHQFRLCPTGTTQNASAYIPFHLRRVRRGSANRPICPLQIDGRRVGRRDPRCALAVCGSASTSKGPPRWKLITVDSTSLRTERPSRRRMKPGIIDRLDGRRHRLGRRWCSRSPPTDMRTGAARCQPAPSALIGIGAVIFRRCPSVMTDGQRKAVAVASILAD
jgi:hypothetical protein